MSLARWLARNSIIRKSARPRVERIFFDDRLICWRFLPTATMMPPSRGIFRPETRKLPEACALLQEDDVRRHVRVDLVEAGLIRQFYDEHGPSMPQNP